MGVTKFNEERESPVSPARLFKALITEAHHSLPELLPQVVKAVEVEGHGVGSTKKTVFTEGKYIHTYIYIYLPCMVLILYMIKKTGSGLNYLKHRIDSVNAENLSCKYTLIEGDILGLDKNIESISYLVKFEPSGNGGCVIKSHTEYHTKGEAKLKEEHIKAGKEDTIALSQMVEDYLVKNPNTYA